MRVVAAHPLGALGREMVLRGFAPFLLTPNSKLQRILFNAMTNHSEGTSRNLPAEEEDAHRRFLLALRAVTVRRQRDEQNSAAIAEWSTTLDREMTDYRRIARKRRMRKLVRGLAIAFAALTILGFGRRLGLASNMLPVALILLFTANAIADAAATSRTKTATALARARDPRALSALAIAALHGDNDTRTVASQGVRSIMESIRTSEAHLITEQGMEALIRLLDVSDTETTVAILRGFEQVGDKRALPAVARIAAPGDRALSMRMIHLSQFDRERARAAAEACLPFLEMRAEADMQRSVLLRPAESPSSPADTLLRPAGYGEAVPVEQLLRPAQMD